MMILYRVIRPIPDRELEPGQFVRGADHPWIERMLKEDKIAIYKPSLEDDHDQQDD